ncbi:hypothetical protein CC85DRAFT_43504 [Cutaneotrichosporon oleaginosum]|uniref:Uncharacterized protein n=1 Tax=Cutaneotrichosporon oleaginosum TaxID=879819 RepID=A0A0J0XRQ6_9TREE|nr:uncharacterized protein CC85DRAFT_43504 [Cutaneotrichosporon oleaginosum]KLT43773.1 hypothetical protein CC85DRAFT_43504 [Cutaneotrichosporon oleaginosum]TXT05189.1 hypothetical protein COLE_06509 [Cutaneotrichosporon oleaginosum]
MLVAPGFEPALALKRPSVCRDVECRRLWVQASLLGHPSLFVFILARRYPNSSGTSTYGSVGPHCSTAGVRCCLLPPGKSCHRLCRRPGRLVRAYNRGTRANYRAARVHCTRHSRCTCHARCPRPRPRSAGLDRLDAVRKTPCRSVSSDQAVARTAHFGPPADRRSARVAVCECAVMHGERGLGTAAPVQVLMSRRRPFSGCCMLVHVLLGPPVAGRRRARAPEIPHPRSTIYVSSVSRDPLASSGRWEVRQPDLHETAETW